MAAAIDVRRARRDDTAALAVVLARAFHDDPIYVWAFPDPARRARLLPAWMRSFVLTAYGALGPTDVGVVDGYVVGGAVWTRAGRLEPGPWASLRMLPGMLRAVGPSGVAGFVGLGKALQQIRPAEPHQYLFHLGTDPGWWGQGVGSGLLRPRLADHDERSLPTYLECKPDNIGYYRRYGFEVTERAPFDAVELWGMLRPPE